MRNILQKWSSLESISEIYADKYDLLSSWSNQIKSNQIYCNSLQYIQILYNNVKITIGKEHCIMLHSLLVELLSTQKQVDCSDCDTSTKFGTRAMTCSKTNERWTPGKFAF